MNAPFWSESTLQNGALGWRWSKTNYCRTKDRTGISSAIWLCSYKGLHRVNSEKELERIENGRRNRTPNLCTKPNPLSHPPLSIDSRILFLFVARCSNRQRWKKGKLSISIFLLKFHRKRCKYGNLAFKSALFSRIISYDAINPLLIRTICENLFILSFSESFGS